MGKLRDALDALRFSFRRRPFSGDHEWGDKMEMKMRNLANKDVVRFCEGCKRPECDLGCVYPEGRTAGGGGSGQLAPQGHGIATIATGGGGGGGTPPSIHDPIRPFGAPLLKPTISDAYRNVAQDVASTIGRMLSTCEEARSEGLRLIEALNEAGEWHDDFQENFAASAIQQATILRDTWKKQVDELHAKNAALKAAAARPENDS